MDSLEGRIEERRLLDVFLLLARRQGSGILTVQGEQEIIGLSFLGGELVSADALNQSMEERLGEILVGDGSVSPEVLANLSAEHHAGGGRVIDLLVERNYVAREVLHRALRRHIFGLCVQVLRWQRGEFKFYRGDEVAFEAGVQPLPVDELFVRAAAELGSGDLFDGELPSPETVYDRVDRLDDSLSADTLGELLGPGLATPDPGEQIESLLDRVNGRRSVSELATASGISDYRARLTLLRMEQADLVRRPRSAGRAPAAAPPAAAPPAASPTPPAPPPPPSRKPAAQVSGPPPEPPAVEAPPAAAPAAPAVERRRRIAAPAARTAPLLGAVLALAVLLATGLAPWRLLLPMPWHADLRQALEAEREAAEFVRVDRAARTFFLLEGRFPESLTELHEPPLLPAGELGGLTYSSTAGSFSLGRPGSGAARTEGIAGNFLLDPEFQATSSRREPPLVLLD